MTPKLRFPNYSNEWKRIKLIDISSRITRKNDAGNTNVLTISAQYGFINQEKFFSKIVASRDLSGYYLLEKGDFAYNKSYSNGYPRGVIKRLNKASGVVSPLYICFRPNNLIDSNFISHYFDSGKQNHGLYKITQEGARNHGLLNIAVSDFFEMELTIPTDAEEQQKIAEFLMAVDERIELASRKVEKLETYKRGLTQKIFTRTLRFKRDDGSDFPEWEDKHIGDIGKVVTGKTPATSKKELWNGGLAFITPTDIVEGKKYQSLTERTVSEGYVNDILPVGTTVFTCIASIGKMAITSAPSVTNQQINSIIPSALVNQEFLFYAVQSIAPKIKASQASNTLPIINKTEFSKFRIPVPDKAEQQKIATFLSQIDEKITLETEKLEELKKFKKALLQRMFV